MTGRTRPGAKAAPCSLLPAPGTYAADSAEAATSSPRPAPRETLPP
ncbi:hypothetical protein ABR737_14020 [Streptomyces sp. Edi2]